MEIIEVYAASCRNSALSGDEYIVITDVTVSNAPGMQHVYAVRAGDGEEHGVV